MKAGYKVETKFSYYCKWILVDNYPGLNEVVNWHVPLNYKVIKSKHSIGLWKLKKRKYMNLLSDCCGAAEWYETGLCSECKEHSEFLDNDEI